MGASSRLRSYQYIPYYESQGISCTVNPLFNKQYLEELYKKKPVSKINVFISYLKRVKQLFSASKYSLLIIEKELFPYLPSFAEWCLKKLKIPYVVDYDDAIFHNYDLNQNPVIRKLFSGKIKSVMRYASLVVAGNSYIADFANKAGAKKIVIIPTVIDTVKYNSCEKNQSEEIIIGWVGSPTTLKYLKTIQPVLKELCESYHAKLRILGGKEGIGLDNREEIIEWSEEKEIDIIKNFDIGIMPLQDTFWEQGKCGYKLIQYMGCGLPVIGSPVGVNKEIIRDGLNGFKPATLNEWKQALKYLIEDASLRRSFGLAGRKMVEQKFSLQRTQKKWIENIIALNNKNA